MTIPLQLTFTGMEPSETVERCARFELDKLERVHPLITRCDLAFEAHTGNQRHGAWGVELALALPAGRVAVEHDSGGDESHEDPLITLQEAFVAVRRALLDHARRARRESKEAAATSLAPE